MEIQIKEEGQIRIVNLIGSLDTNTSSEAEFKLNELIENVELVRILRMDSTFIASHQNEIDQLIKSLIEEGYEIIGSAHEKKILNELFLYEKEDRIEGFIISRKEEGSLLIIELIGFQIRRLFKCLIN